MLMTALRFLQTISFKTGCEEIANAYEPWFEHIVGSNHLLALSIPACAIKKLPVAKWTALRHLQIRFALHDWVSDSFLAALRLCPLESLRMVYELYESENEFEMYEWGPLKLPAMRFESMPSLNHVDLYGCFPAEEFTLPEACHLRLTLTEEDLSSKFSQWKGGADKIAHWGSVLDVTQANMKAWPPGIQQFPNLQYLELKCECVEQGLDLAALKHIPNISLYLQHSFAELCFSSGSWKSIQIHGATVAFGDIGEFVKGTEKFLFVGDDFYVDSMAGKLKQACGRHHVECFTRTCKATVYSSRIREVSITNVRDIYEAGTGDCGCCCMQLVSCSDFWPSDSLHERVFGKGHSGCSQDNEPHTAEPAYIDMEDFLLRMRLQELGIEMDSDGEMRMMADDASADDFDEEEDDFFYG